MKIKEAWYFSHFLKDRNCEVCSQTKMTRAHCRRRTGEAVLRAEKYGDSITSDHEVLNEGDDSRNNHRSSFVVQDFATQWIHSYPCKTKTSQETAEESLQKFLEPVRRTDRKLYTQTTRWNLANPVLIDPKRRYCCESCTQSERKNFSGTATIRIR